MTHSFNASTTFHRFSPSPISSSIIGGLKAVNFAQSTSSSIMSSSTTQTVSATSLQTQPPGLPSLFSHISSISASSQPPHTTTVLTEAPTSQFTVNGIVVATSIAPFSAVGAPAATPVDLATPTPSATDTSSAAASTSLSRPGLISISVVGGVVAILFVSLLFFALRRRRRLLDGTLQLDSAPGSPTSRQHSHPRPRSPSETEISDKSASTFSESRASPAPFPIFTNSPYFDEKEVFTPGPQSSGYLITKGNKELQLAIPSPSFSPRRPSRPDDELYRGLPSPTSSPRRPTHPLLASRPPPSLLPVTTTVATSSIPGSARRSWNFDVTPPRRSLDLPVQFELTSVNSHPEIRSQSQNPPVSPMYPMSPLTPGANFPAPLRTGPITPVSPLVGRTEFPSPQRTSPGPATTMFSDISWGADSAQRASHAGEEVDVVLSMPAPSQEPVELSADRVSRGTLGTPASFVGMAPAPTRVTTTQGRSDRGKSVASSRYSQASGWSGAEGDRVIPDMPADGLQRTTTWKSNDSTGKSRRSSWSEGNFSIQSILDLMRSASQKGQGSRV